MKRPHPEWITPEWNAPGEVHAFVTTRAGGCSGGPWSGLNLGIRSGDRPQDVARNRAILRESLPDMPRWLRQVHGWAVVDAGSGPWPDGQEPEADASFTLEPGVVCTVLVADCMPVFLCDSGGSAVAVAHAGWRGLAGGVLEATVRAMGVPPHRLLAWLGPAIGPRHFEVGEDVVEAFAANDAGAAGGFRPYPGRDGKWLCDLPWLARRRLADAGVGAVSGGQHCTVSDARLYSHRRDRGVSGRMAAVIWRESRPVASDAPGIVRTA